jgi:hypothetical protein
MAPKSVVDLLAAQSPDALVSMLETARAEYKTAQDEVERKRAEVALIEDALVKARRRESGGRLTRDQVFEVLKAAGEPMDLDEVHRRLTAQGMTATRDSVREHLRRLVEKNGTVLRDDEGRYWAAFVPSPAEDDIPF